MTDWRQVVSTVAATAIGGGLVVAADARRDRRVDRRESEAAAKAAIDRQREFQRATLIELQEQATAYVEMCGPVLGAIGQERLSPMLRRSLPTELRDAFFAARMRTSVLHARVDDDHVRAIATEVRSRLDAALVAGDPAEAEREHAAAVGKLEELNVAIGECLRAFRPGPVA